mmetsp:Transcript_1207/g.3671  ORF Transcript_1207/g.3671 Transcript_1207/m.3671 type:complete len:219 (+) Transcript_1207:127-783(+)
MGLPQLCTPPLRRRAALGSLRRSRGSAGAPGEVRGCGVEVLAGFADAGVCAEPHLRVAELPQRLVCPERARYEQGCLDGVERFRPGLLQGGRRLATALPVGLGRGWPQQWAGIGRSVLRVEAWRKQGLLLASAVGVPPMAGHAPREEGPGYQNRSDPRAARVHRKLRGCRVCSAVHHLLLLWARPAQNDRKPQPGQGGVLVFDHHPLGGLGVVQRPLS